MSQHRFYAIGRQLVGQHIPCFCADGTQAGRVKCTTCNGTGRGKRGGAGGCKDCHGFRTRFDQSVRETCTMCDGTGLRKHATICDNADDNVIDTIPFVVVHRDRALSLTEQYLGMGLFSCTDYGAHKSLTDEQLIDKVRSQCTHVQATKIADDDGTIVAAIAIITADHGYTVIGSRN